MDIVSKAVNKVSYQINQAVTDPAAEEAAARKARAAQIEAAAVKEAEAKKVAAATKEAALVEESKTEFDTIKDIFFKTLIIGLGIFLLCLGGSLAANAAIHRHIAIRLLYFAYGSAAGVAVIFLALINPFFLLLGALLSFIIYKMDMRPHWYTFLPISAKPATSGIGKVLWSLFYWDPERPDHKVAYLEKLKKYKEFLEEGIKTIGSTAAST